MGRKKRVGRWIRSSWVAFYQLPRSLVIYWFSIDTRRDVFVHSRFHGRRRNRKGLERGADRRNNLSCGLIPAHALAETKLTHVISEVSKRVSFILDRATLAIGTYQLRLKITDATYHGQIRRNMSSWTSGKRKEMSKIGRLFFRWANDESTSTPLKRSD